MLSESSEARFLPCGGSTTGAIQAGAEVRLAVNHWSRALETHQTNYPHVEHVLTDISQADPRRYPSTTVLLASPECFPAGTLILTKRGLLPIETIQVGDEVLTHRNRWRAVTSLMSRNADTLIVKGRGHIGLELTGTHPIWVRRCTYPRNKERRRNERFLHPPQWKTAEQLNHDDFWAMPRSFGEEELPIPEIGGRGAVFTPAFWWMVGRWLGDGSLRLRFGTPHEHAPRRPHRLMPALCEVCSQPAKPLKRYPHLAQFYCSKTCKSRAGAVSNDRKGSSVQICCAHREADMLEAQLNFAPPKGARAGIGEYRWSRRKMRTAVLFDCPHNGLARWLLEHFGQHADGKYLPPWVLTMPEEWRRSLLDGYVSADGNLFRDGVAIATVSRSLAVGIMLLAASLGFHPVVGVNRRSRYSIEGRSGVMRTLYHVRWAVNGERFYAEATENHVWGRIKAVIPGRQQVEVFNLSVDEDESYVADGIIVHNCTNHSLSKGVRRKGQAQLGLWEQKPPDPAEERSRCTMWDPLRFAEYHQYQFIILENVVDARYWRLWDAWLHGWQSLDYQWQIVYFNSMFAHPTPQSRDRMYVVLWKRKNRAPDLCITPRAFCSHCDRDIEAVQSWKNPAKSWGKYGKNGQYVYCCPSCATEVMPYYYAAFNAIDWSIPTTRIGERKKPLKEKTLRRIELGLRRFCGDAFTVQVNKTTDRVRPVYTEVFPTQTADNGIALVHPPFLLTLSHDSGNERRVIGLSHPFPTQTAREDVALLLPPFLIELRSHASARSLTDPLATICAGGEHHALITTPFILDHVHEYRVRSLAAPLSTIVAEGNHQSVVLPPAWLMSYYNTGHLAPVETPVPTITTLDRHALMTVEESREEIRIEDCGFRMLEPQEIQAAMAFPREYVVLGNRREKVKQLGNAVTAPVMKLLMQRCLASLA